MAVRTLAQGQEKINLAFVASLFYQHPGLPAAGASAQEAFRAAMQERIAQQVRRLATRLVMGRFSSIQRRRSMHVVSRQERGFKEKLAQEEESLRQRWAAEEKERMSLRLPHEAVLVTLAHVLACAAGRRQMQEEEEAQRRRLEEQERALRAEWERRVQRGEEVDQWRSAEEQRIAALRAAQEAKSAELAREMESVAQERKYWAEQHSQLAAQKAQLEQLESAKRAQWEHEEAERRGRWEREEAERRQRWEQEDRARQAAQVPPQQAPGTLLEFGGTYRSLSVPAYHQKAATGTLVLTHSRQPTCCRRSTTNATTNVPGRLHSRIVCRSPGGVHDDVQPVLATVCADATTCCRLPAAAVRLSGVSRIRLLAADAERDAAARASATRTRTRTRTCTRTRTSSTNATRGNGHCAGSARGAASRPGASAQVLSARSQPSPP